MDRVSDLRDRLVRLDELLDENRFGGRLNDDEFEALSQERDEVEARYFDLVDEEIDHIMAMENGLGYF